MDVRECTSETNSGDLSPDMGRMERLSAGVGKMLVGGRGIKEQVSVGYVMFETPSDIE